MFQHKYNIGMFLLLNHIYQTQAESFHQHLILLGHSKHGALIKYRYLLKFLEYLESEGLQNIAEIQPLHITTYYNTIKITPSKKTNQPIAIKTLQHHMRSVELFFYDAPGYWPVNNQSLQCLKIYLSQRIQWTHSIDAGRNTAVLQRLPELPGTCNIKPCLRLRPTCVRDGKLQRGRYKTKRGHAYCQAWQRQQTQGNPTKQHSKTRPVQLLLLRTTCHAWITRNRFYVAQQRRENEKKTYNKILKLLVERTENEAIKQKQISIHTLRHSIATHLLEQGMNVEQVREFLGHAELETTEIYTHVNQNQLNKLTKCWAPIRKNK